MRLGRLGGDLGATWRRLVGSLGTSLGRLGASFGRLGASLGRLGGAWLQFIKYTNAAVKMHIMRLGRVLKSSLNRQTSF